jgi:hypothetical protein
LQATTVYLALSQPDTNNRLVRDALYSPVAPLLMVDLIAHKGYYQMRQYRLGDLDKRYHDSIEALAERTSSLLDNLSQVAVTAGELARLATEYNLLTRVNMYLNQLHIALKRLEHNFSWWYKRADSDDISEFHHHHLENSTQELELLVTEGQRPLEAAKTAVDIIQAQLDKRQEGQQQRIETILSAVAVVFSILALVDKETAQAFLNLIGIHTSNIIWPELAVQLACIVIFSFATVFTLRLLRRTRRAR